ncbi:MAG TPA: hypothetical protein P5229_04310 [Candidatus Gracilibacteria bacterium]|nr:hypothetical protein [Candidatus Gracilibacteria bacterium]
MPEKPHSENLSVEAYLPEDFPYICGSLGIDQKVYELDSLQNLEPNEYAETISRWENLGIILNGFTSWHKLPTSIQEAIKSELIIYFKLNPNPTTQDVRYAIWKAAGKHLKKQGLVIEVEKHTRRSPEDISKVTNIRIVSIMHTTDKKIMSQLDKFLNDAPSTVPGIPRAIKSAPPSQGAPPLHRNSNLQEIITRRSQVILKQIQPETTSQDRNISKPVLPREHKG